MTIIIIVINTYAKRMYVRFVDSLVAAQLHQSSLTANTL